MTADWYTETQTHADMNTHTHTTEVQHHISSEVVNRPSEVFLRGVSSSLLSSRYLITERLSGIINEPQHVCGIGNAGALGGGKAITGCSESD